MKPKARRSSGLWTAARISATLFLGPVGALMAILYVSQAEPIYDFGMGFVGGVVVASMYIGWTFMGREPGFGYTKSVIKGFAAGVYIYVAAVIWQGIIFAYSGLSASSFDSPEIIPGAIIEAIVFFASEMFVWPVVLTCAIGGTLMGRIVGMINWHWR